MPDTEPKINNPSKSLIETRTHEYNDFFTKLDQLENNPQITTDEYITKNGKTIKRYNLSGTDFAFLSHTVGINIPNSNLSTSQNIRTEISLWDTTKPGEANNQISCSLITADHISHAVHFQESQAPQVMLGFAQLEDGQLILAKPGDVGSVVEKNHTPVPDENNLSKVKDVLNTGNNGKMYNEVVITRYNQDGQVRKPDFIITFDNRTNDRIEQTIDYFNVPVVNFNTEEYLNRSDYQTEQILKGINETTSLKELKNLHQQIVSLHQNKDLWRDYSESRKYSTGQEQHLIQEISDIEKTIIDQQLDQNREIVAAGVEKFKKQTNIESLQEIKTILIKLTEEQSVYPIYFISPQENESGEKWREQSQRLLSNTLISVAPDIINFYQNQLLYFSQNVDNLSTPQIEEELKKFFEYSVLSESNSHPRLRRQDVPSKSYDIITLQNQQNQQELIDLLNKIFSAQEKLKTTIFFGVEQSRQKDQQKQIESQNKSLETASSSFESMINLFESSSNNPDFKQKILSKIKEKLIGNRGIIEIVEDVRNHHHNPIVKLYEEYLASHFDNEVDKEIHRIITNPNQISQTPQEITMSQPIDTSTSHNNPFQVLTVTTSDNQLFVFQIYQRQGSSYRLKKIEDNQNNKDTINTINQRWFWRFRHQIPRIKNNNTYELKGDDSDRQPLLTKNKKGEWCLVTNLSVQEIKTKKMNIQ